MKMRVDCSFEIECGMSFQELQKYVDDHKAEIQFSVDGGEILKDIPNVNLEVVQKVWDDGPNDYDQHDQISEKELFKMFLNERD